MGRKYAALTLTHRSADLLVVQHLQYAVRHIFQLRQKIILHIELPQRRIVCDALHHMAAVRAVRQIQHPLERQLPTVAPAQLVDLHLHQSLKSHGIHIAECTELLCQCVELVQIVPIKMWGEKFISAHVLHLSIGFLSL